MGMTPGKGGDLNSEINVTPLVDVMLVLLIIFMVTAPMLETGLDIELPAGEAKSIDDDEGKLVLSIDKTGKAYLSGTAVAWEELALKLSTNAKVKADKELYIEADKSIRYELVMQAMLIAHEAGVTKLMFKTDPTVTAPEARSLDEAVNGK